MPDVDRRERPLYFDSMNETLARMPRQAATTASAHAGDMVKTLPLIAELAWQQAELATTEDGTTNSG